MSKPTHFKTITGQKLKLPLFFPDATRAVLKTLDSTDIKNTHTPGILVNTYHLHQRPGISVIKSQKGVRGFMSWDGACISDSGGFQVMSIAKQNPKRNPITNQGVTFHPAGSKKVLFTPEKCIQIQLALKTDLMVVLDDFTPPGASLKVAKDTVERTILWAKGCKKEFDKRTKNLPANKRPYLIAVVQGGDHLDLRKECAQRLVEIGFDGLGYGGWPMNKDGTFNYSVAQVIKKHTPEDYLLYGLGIGKPDEIARLVKEGWHIFDCVLPTRDARHRRLYVYNNKKFFSYFTPTKEKYYRDHSPVSTACDCLLCKNYSRSYLHHLFKLKEVTAQRLATIHNLRFYSLLMQKLSV